MTTCIFSQQLKIVCLCANQGVSVIQLLLREEPWLLNATLKVWPHFHMVAFFKIRIAPNEYAYIYVCTSVCSGNTLNLGVCIHGLFPLDQMSSFR